MRKRNCKIAFAAFMAALLAVAVFAGCNKAAAITADRIAAIPAQRYTGQALTPTPEIDGLTLGTDFDVTYADNVSVGTASVTVTGKGNYSGSVTVTFAINKAVPTGTMPTASALNYGQTLADSTLTGGEMSTGGTFAWADPSTVPTAVNDGYDVTFTPTDSANYEKVTEKVAVSVAKGPVTLTKAPTAEEGTLYAGGTFPLLKQGAASVPGTFVWTAGQTLTVGTKEYDWLFVPSETGNYDSLTGKLPLTAIKGTPTVSENPIAQKITYGQTLSNSALTGGTVSVPGTFAWVSGATVPTVTNDGYEVLFTPDNTDNYDTVTVTVGLIVDKATPTVSAWPTSADLTYGQTLSGSALTGGTASVDGAFAWADGATVPTAVNDGYDVTFTPTDSANVATVTKKIAISVAKAAVTVSVQNNVCVFDGTAKAVTVVTDPANVANSVSYSGDGYGPTADAPSAAGTYTVTVTVDENYTPSKTEFSLTIKEAVALSGGKKLFSKLDGATAAPTYAIGGITGEIVSVSLDGAPLTKDTDYTVADGTLTLICDLSALENGVKPLLIETDTKIYQASVYVCDVVITSENADDYMTNGGAKTLAVKNDAVYPGSTKTRLSLYYVLADDIDMTEKAFKGIGRYSLAASYAFTGTFDGNGHKISNWTSSDLMNRNTGFFSILDKGSKLMNLGLENLTFTMSGSDLCYVGGIAGAINGTTISNCYINGLTITFATPTHAVLKANGLFGGNNGISKIENCLLYGEITITDAKETFAIGFLTNNNTRPLDIKNAFVASEGFPEGTELFAPSNFLTQENTGFKTADQLKGAATDDNADYSAYSPDLWNIATGSLPTLKPQYSV